MLLSGCVVVTKWALHPVSAIRVGVSGGDRLSGKLVVEERVEAVLTCISKSGLLSTSIVAPTRQLSVGAVGVLLRALLRGTKSSLVRKMLLPP